MYPENDNSFEDKLITKVSLDKAGWTITTNDGWSFSQTSGIVPEVGDIARFYGRGIGSIIRGLFINGVRIFYRTEKEQEIKIKQDLEKMQLEKQKTFLVKTNL